MSAFVNGFLFAIFVALALAVFMPNTEAAADAHASRTGSDSYTVCIRDTHTGHTGCQTVNFAGPATKTR